jgi:hypothetical protein
MYNKRLKSQSLARITINDLIKQKRQFFLEKNDKNILTFD